MYQMQLILSCLNVEQIMTVEYELTNETIIENLRCAPNATRDTGD